MERLKEIKFDVTETQCDCLEHGNEPLISGVARFFNARGEQSQRPPLIEITNVL